MSTSLEPTKILGTQLPTLRAADIPAGTLTHSTTIYTKIIDCRHLRLLSLLCEWAAVASTAGSWYLEVSDDPKVSADIRRGINTGSATWIERTIPSGSIDGTNIVVSGKTITIDANAGKFSLVLTDLPAYARLKYVSSAGGGANQANAYASGKE